MTENNEIMQSSHFDAYSGTIYGTPAGFDSSTGKTHLPGYAPEPDGGCYSTYGAPSLQAMSGYNCRETSGYSETSSFLHSGFVSNYGNGNYYKMPTRQMELTEYNSMTMSRCQENFLMKPESALSNSQNLYEPDNQMNVHSERNHHLHQHHQQPHLQSDQHTKIDHEQVATYHDSTPALDDPKRLHDPTIYGLNPIKLEPPTSHLDYKTSSSSSSSSTPSNPRSLHQQETVLNTASCEDTSTQPTQPHYLEPKNDKLLGLESPLEKQTSSAGKDCADEKRDEDTSADAKPTMSYIALIAKAILESEQRRLNLGSIYNWIEKHYPFYKNKGQGWRNSVRHNLSLNDCFIKAGRCEDGKGNYWAIHPANIQDFMRGDFRQRRRSRRRGRKKECDLSMYHVPNTYLQPQATPLAQGMGFNTAALSTIYSPYTEAERRLDEALLRQSMNNPFVKWYQQGVAAPGYGVSTSPPACGSGVYPNPNPVQWPQAYTEAGTQSMYPAMNPTFTR
ncbi:forkhead box protein K1-like isoform X2 [Physella acuta]|uniref:forkhead box protein K1-like isoform X2 n=1 Tax=Physella acuta TaxID=109671 RepID=UPI0027DBABB7|nr:forkhead box protein K1-like isoform X2 [Physella acuta]